MTECGPSAPRIVGTPRPALHKRRLSFAELLGPLDAILELAKTPAPFTVPNVRGDQRGRRRRLASRRRPGGKRRRSEGRSTRRRQRHADLEPLDARLHPRGAGTGDRHRLLFSAAANLGEFGCSPALAVALLEESALDSGLPPKDVRRQIECGIVACLRRRNRRNRPRRDRRKPPWTARRSRNRRKPLQAILGGVTGNLASN